MYGCATVIFFVCTASMSYWNVYIKPIGTLLVASDSWPLFLYTGTIWPRLRSYVMYPSSPAAFQIPHVALENIVCRRRASVWRFNAKGRRGDCRGRDCPRPPLACS